MTEPASIRALDPQDIACVAESQSTSLVNEYLSLGWVVVGISSNHYSEHGFSLNYHLAWSRKKGEPKYPAKRDWSSYLSEQSGNEENPAPF